MNQRTYRKTSARRKSSAPSSEFLHVLLFYILPFIVINSIIFFVVTSKPKYELVVAETDDYRTTTATFTITSHMPLRNVTITYNSEPLDLVKVGNKSYQATLTNNGILDVFMENFNGMSVSNYEVVDILDDEAPSITSYDMNEGQLTVVVTDSQSGIDYDSLYGTAPDQTVVLPSSIDKTTGTVVFPIDQNGLTLSIKDLSGNEYLPSFSVVKGEDTDNNPATEEQQILIQ